MIKIEEGKFYLNRTGGLVGPMKKQRMAYQSESKWLASVGGECHQFMDSGRYLNGGKAPSYDNDPRDIVQLFTPPPVATANPLTSEPPYSSLAGILQMALDQAASGKGRERHSDDKPFLEQPIMEIARMLNGTGGHAYQIMKKAQEANRMVAREQLNAAVAEYLGVINYAAAAILLIREL